MKINIIYIYCDNMYIYIYIIRVKFYTYIHMGIHTVL